MKSLSLKALVFSVCATFVKKLYNEFAVSVILLRSVLVVAETGVSSFVGKISFMHCQNFAGFILFSVNRSL